MTVCIEVNGEKLQSCTMNLTLIGQSQMSNSSEVFSYTTICSSFRWIEKLHFELSCTQTYTQTHTYGHDYSIVAVDKPQLAVDKPQLYIYEQHTNKLIKTQLVTKQV